MSSVTIDGDDLTGLGWKLVSTKGLNDSATQSTPIATLPAAGIPVQSGSLYAVQPRQFSVTYAIRNISLAAIQAAFAGLSAKVKGKTVVVTTARRANQQIVAFCTSIPADVGVGPEFVGPYYVSVEIGFTAPNPFFTDTAGAAESIAFTSTPVAVPFGTAGIKSYGVLTIVNSTGSTITNPHILQKNASGVTVVDLLTICSIPAGDAIEIDGVLQRIRKRTSGVWTQVSGYVASGFAYPRHWSGDGVYGTSTGTIQTDKGSGTFAYPRLWD